MKNQEQKLHPGWWISILYFAQGFPYTVVNIMSVVFLKGLGTSNELIGLTSFLSLPWVIKGLWGPIVDIYSTKRRWILRMEILCTILFLILALGALFPQAIPISIAIFALIAFISATHDIAIDGFYLTVLNLDQQAFYVGVRNTAYRMAVLAGGGGLVFLAGNIAEKYSNGKSPTGEILYNPVQLNFLGSNFSIPALQWGWSIAFSIASLIFLFIYGFQKIYLPKPQKATFSETENLSNSANFINSFKTYFTQYKIGWTLAFILLFRLGDALTFKMATPFLMDTAAKGGLGITTAEIGILSGTVGVIFLLFGGLLGGFLIAKQGLKTWIWPMAILQNFTNIFYWLLAKTQPEIIWAYVVNSLEQFTYGLGVAAYTVFLMQTVRPEYKASHYAITTAFMAAGVLIPGVFSGYIQADLGYQNYFLLSAMAVIPGLLTIFFIPKLKTVVGL
ncbi:MFS transporter [Planktothrix agardhii]|uniref:MFS transporter n=1 Tax=Planktothrix agardhii TaxID=1160 RepID=UPI001F44625E|nr:MFS transporter [Planktothrix agardhii]MCF3577513.1 MFS transporter [Planktothrix agardhii 1812]